jgi:hypothetical protein
VDVVVAGVAVAVVVEGGVVAMKAMRSSRKVRCCTSSSQWSMIGSGPLGSAAPSRASWTCNGLISPGDVVGGGQNSNVGMLPPSSSDDDSDGEAGAKADKPAAATAAMKSMTITDKSPKEKGQSKNVGKLPGSGSDEDEESESSEDEAPMPEYLTAPSQRKKYVCLARRILMCM